MYNLYFNNINYFSYRRVDEDYIEDTPIYGNLDNIIPGKFYFSTNFTNNLKWHLVNHYLKYQIVNIYLI